MATSNIRKEGGTAVVVTLARVHPGLVVDGVQDLAVGLVALVVPDLMAAPTAEQGVEDPMAGVAAVRMVAICTIVNDTSLADHRVCLQKLILFFALRGRNTRLPPRLLFNVVYD